MHEKGGGGSHRARTVDGSPALKKNPRAQEPVLDLVGGLRLEKKKKKKEHIYREKTKKR